MDNVHKDHILYSTSAPSSVSGEIGEKAKQIADKIVTALNLVGLLAVEMFVMRDGSVLVNEIALDPTIRATGLWTHAQQANLSSLFVPLLVYHFGIPHAIPMQ